MVHNEKPRFKMNLKRPVQLSNAPPLGVGEMADNRKCYQAYFTQIHIRRRKIRQSYRHLRVEDRIIIKTLLQERKSRKYIAEKLERDLSSLIPTMR